MPNPSHPKICVKNRLFLRQFSYTPEAPSELNLAGTLRSLGSSTSSEKRPHWTGVSMGPRASLHTSDK